MYITSSKLMFCFNSIQDGLSRDCSRMGGEQKGPLSLKSVTHLTMIKIGTFIHYQEKILKIYKSRDTPFVFCWHQNFLLEISKFCYIKKYWYRLYFNTLFLIFLNSIESWKIISINMVAVLLMSAKMDTLELFRIKLSLNKDYDVTTSAMASSTEIYHVTQIIL